MFKKIKVVLKIFAITLLVLIIFDFSFNVLVDNNFLPYLHGQPSNKIFNGPTKNISIASEFLKSDYSVNYLHLNHEQIQKLGDVVLVDGFRGRLEEISEDKKIFRDSHFVFKPNASFLSKRKTFDDILIYDVNYNFDSLSRRQTVQSVNSTSSDKNILLLGCSFTLGTGLNDKETFSSFLASQKKDYRLYNFGIYGGGANDVLDDLNSNVGVNRFSDINKNGGYTIYTGISDHIERSSCSLKCYGDIYKGWVLKKTNYQFNEDLKAMQPIGSFANTRPILGFIYSILAKSSFVKYFHINIPLWRTDQELENYVLLIKEIKKKSDRDFNTQFYFTFYPGTYLEWPRIKYFLDKHQIKYLDFSNVDLINLTNKRNAIVFDGHPTALSNALFAKLIAENLN